METKQTAVEWLEEQFVFFLKDIIENKNNLLCKNLFEKAKQMEKEQMIKSYWASYKECSINTNIICKRV